MMYCASKDYGTGSVTILFDGPRPSEDEIKDFMQRNYGSCEILEIEIEDEHGFWEYINPGVIRVRTR
jgi:hypothetical protein